MTRVYLDHHAATPLVPAALAAMREALPLAWANPSSVHAEGRAARAVLERARDQIAQAFGAAPADVVLTSGGTEAVNLAVLGIARARRARRILTTTVEHPSVTQTIRTWAMGPEREGNGNGESKREEEKKECEGRSEREVESISVRRGTFDLDSFHRALAGGVDMVAMQWASHETGTLMPIEEIALACRSRGIALVIDASQAAGKLPIDASALGADALVVASHKLGGPAGAAAVILARGIDVAPVLAGGAQERGRRPGSPDVVAAAGFGAACTVIGERIAAMPAIVTRRDRLERELEARGGVANAGEARRVATASNVSFRGYRGDLLVAALDLEGVSVASGAACSSGLAAPSPVLLAMYEDEPWRAASALRFTLGPETTDEDVTAAIAALDRVLAR